ncbi:hypothetical protein BABINDRAFT_165352 [Babjeviella inositovora NRRL Y-12698]|uniref:Alkyl transferase n=1 Tax=Babjeviella inositovora NRRL Y-12698 TaxID=984486 RepID=A0A1E3QVZ8_9ASCO|nr:uncharacterized protein BABINDRAFT_165352 [Babjeviella inositovora NRRL Y-12698]ODQ81833.1 hypothetical protein BABINDRAFT_165352 [Babjeviella inositovora NRRL Y-12698]
MTRSWLFRTFDHSFLLKYAAEFAQRVLTHIIRTGPVPKHIALIMDGNRRFAKQNNLQLKDGHIAGAQSLAKMQVLEASYKFGIDTVTVYAFSIENFNRPKAEIDTLFGMLREKLQTLNDSNFTGKEGLRIRIIGNKGMIPEDILTDLMRIEDASSKEYTYTLNVCFPYTSRDDIANSIKTVLHKVDKGELSIDEIDQKVLYDNMYFGADSPHVDILIRTSGHTRLSDFMLWQSNYNSTIEFVDVLWPNFNFVRIAMVIVKWSYYKTLMLE